MKGTVKFFKRDSGYGFISGDDGKDYFVHQSGIEGDIVLQEGDQVTFEVEQGDRGPKAANVKKASEEEAQESSEEPQEASEDSEETQEADEE